MILCVCVVIVIVFVEWGGGGSCFGGVGHFFGCWAFIFLGGGGLG